MKTRNRAGQAFRLAAQAVSRSRNRLGAFYWRMRARPGPKSDLVATAHMLTHRTSFQDRSAEDYEQRAREREVAVLRHKATEPSLIVVEAWV